MAPLSPCGPSLILGVELLLDAFFCSPGRRQVFRQGTNGSNPVPSSGESTANLSSKSIVIRDRRVREAPNLLRVIPSGGATRRPAMFSYCRGWDQALRTILPRRAISVQGGEGSTQVVGDPRAASAGDLYCGVSRRAAVPALSPAAGCAIPTGSPTPASSPTTAAPATQSVSRREFVTWGSSAALPFRPRFRDLRL